MRTGTSSAPSRICRRRRRSDGCSPPPGATGSGGARWHPEWLRCGRRGERELYARSPRGRNEVAELSREVGLGLAARGSVADAVAWAQRARALGLSSVWVHDSYFERDAVTYASALASHLDGINVALGAVNPFTRHAVVLAMTVSALDEMAPGRVILGLGSALPLRLAQMGIPYTPQAGRDRVSAAIDTLRGLWQGERVPPGTEGVPPVEPMFAPVHHVPIYVAGYRTPMLELAGRKGDGYLARPLESLASFRAMVPKIRKASVNAGRPEDAVDVAGYLFGLVDESRRAAL